MTGEEKILELMIADLKETHENLIRKLLLDDQIEMRWNEDYFPFTDPSFELEIFINGKWLEVLGCGKIFFYYILFLF